MVIITDGEVMVEPTEISERQILIIPITTMMIAIKTVIVMITIITIKSIFMFRMITVVQETGVVMEVPTAMVDRNGLIIITEIVTTIGVLIG